MKAPMQLLLSAGVVLLLAMASNAQTAPTIITQPASQTSALGGTIHFSVSASGTGSLAYLWRKNAANLANGGNVSGATSQTLTLSNIKTNGQANYTCRVSNNSGSVTSQVATLTVIVPPAIITQPKSSNTNVGATVTFAVTASGTAPFTYQWYKDAVSIPDATLNAYTLAGLSVGDSGAYSVRLSNAAGSVTSSNAVLIVGVAPSIAVPPSSLTVTQGQSATFTVSANGTPLNYLWRKNGVPIAKATNSSFTIPTALGSSAGAYTVVVSNFLKSVTSLGAILTVIVPVSITEQPASQTVGEGSNATFTVTATGTGLSYQWFKGATNIAGATHSSLTINSVQFNDQADYTVTVSNVLSVVTSQVATLTVQRFAPAITDQPASQNIAIGSGVTFTVGATGTTLNYQWLKDATNILDATGRDLSLNAVTLADAGGYSVIVANSLGSVTSIVANLNLGHAPVVVQPPLALTTDLGAVVSFSCTVTGSPPISLQWLVNGTPLPEQTNSTLTLTNLDNSDFGYYALAATNIFGDTISPSAQLHFRDARYWAVTDALSTARRGHTATLLPSGKVLVAGGFNDSSGYLSSAELFDPGTGTWIATGPMATNRIYHTATLLPNGKVLVAGGYNGSALPDAELYDPAAGMWKATSALNTARHAHTATLLPDGRVLVAAGRSTSSSLSSAELYDPATGSWTATGDLTTERGYLMATLLLNGKVLVAGGLGLNDSVGNLFSAELYDPTTAMWSQTGALIAARRSHTPTLLPNGEVLVAGGWNGGSLPSAELYEPGAGTWRMTGAMSNARSSHTATLLPNGKVLVAGGWNGGSLSSVEQYDPVTGRWGATAAMTSARWEQTATLLLDGRVLIAGGDNGNGTVPSAELYDKAQADVTLGDLLQTYDGTPRCATATTIPPRLTVQLTYDGTTNAQINVGSYVVIATVNDLNYQGSATNTLVILLALAPIALTGAAMEPSGAFQFGFTNMPGLTFSVLTATDVGSSMSSWTVLGSAAETPLGSGQFRFTDLQATNAPQRFYGVRFQ